MEKINQKDSEWRFHGQHNTTQGYWYFIHGVRCTPAEWEEYESKHKDNKYKAHEAKEKDPNRIVYYFEKQKEWGYSSHSAYFKNLSYPKGTEKYSKPYDTPEERDQAREEWIKAQEGEKSDIWFTNGKGHCLGTIGTSPFDNPDSTKMQDYINLQIAKAEAKIKKQQMKIEVFKSQLNK